ncbi:MAG: undecaprenyl-phosphate galactose phosphotransferase WbaP [Deltaproteobacteria bacterium]|jgi:Undecaprenyl-phosphate galactose phosphotransferase WbaP|nr:undecaprenyl-phosphate galactose phosphotransferase WbaP [Deltaproteobacteria bacterium]
MTDTLSSHAQTASGFVQRLRRPLLLFAVDSLAIIGTAIVIGMIRALFVPQEVALHLMLAPILILAPLYYYMEGLYDAVLPPFPQELRILGTGISLAYLVLGIVLFLSRADLPSRQVVGLAWGCALCLAPLLRVWLRRRFASQAWWGREVVLFGSAEAVASLIRFLRFAPDTGLRPAALVCHGQTAGAEAFAPAALPVLDTTAQVEAYAAAHPGSCAIILGDSFSPGQIRELATQAGRLFSSVFVMLDFMSGETPVWLRPIEIARTTTLQIRQNLLDSRRLALKRGIDLVAAAGGSLILLPFLIGIAVWIRLESPGSAFFTQRRLGMGGRHFDMIKFRTMVTDAEQVLQSCLDQDPELKREWVENHKLRRDPRVTRVGRWLRRTSLDELPQLWNVLRGDMSLVGPRPIVDEEIAKYGSSYAAYVRVRPGMTGLWQVSGRNDTTYAYRVGIDSYYICNWSIWMDIWVLARTPVVMLRGTGAY